MMTISLPPGTGEYLGTLTIVVPAHLATVRRVRVKPGDQVGDAVLCPYVATLEYRTIPIGRSDNLMAPNGDPPYRVPVGD
jgi:hypothetical protein